MKKGRGTRDEGRVVRDVKVVVVMVVMIVMDVDLSASPY